MNNSKTATQKHMTLDDRISIEKGLDQHLSLRSIALQLGKDPTTISKEIKKHRSFQEHNRFNEPANKCALAKDCKKKNICGTCLQKDVQILQSLQLSLRGLYSSILPLQFAG